MIRFAARLLALFALLAPVVRANQPDATPLAGSHILEELYADEIARIREMPPESLPPVERKERVPVGGWTDFWSINMAANQPFQVHAQLRHIGAHCYIYVQEGHEVSDETAKKLAAQFDTKIYPTDRHYFGSERTPGVDWDKRITLLLMDIQDGWTPGKGYVAGYFFPLDGVSTRLFPQSNEREMFYLDIYPGDPTRADYLGILAHEFQHMIHNNWDAKETRWLNEALAQIAFFVNDYGHAPQIFSYIRGTDTALPEFNNGLDDYGSVYLWTYYCLTKFAGDDPEAQAAFTRALVASQAKSTEAFTEVLATVGGPSAEEVFQDWVIANVANAPDLDNGQYGYDETLRFAVQPNATHSLGAGSGKVDGDVLPWAADYITFSAKESYKPLNPTMVDRVLLLAESGEVTWTINGGQTPDAAILPEGSRIEDGKAISPVVNFEDGAGVKVGPFFRKGVEVRSVEFASGDGQVIVPIFTLDQLVEGSQGIRGGFELSVDGKAVTASVVVHGESGTEVHKVDGGKYQRADLSGVDRITLVVAGNPAKKFKKGVKYSYRSKTRRSASDLEQAARLRELEDSAIELAASDMRAATFATKVGSMRRSLEEKMADSMLASHGLGALELAGRVAEVDASNRSHAVQSARAALRMARFKAMDSAVERGEVTGASLEVAEGVSPRGDDEDDAHDNIGYLLFKAGEPVHSLDHLKIDPNMVEGQILSMWRLLEIARGFPHLPIPDGLKLAGEIVEIVYNNSILMADDVTISVYDFVRLIFHSMKVSGDIAKVFESIPIVGKAVKHLKRIIHRKLVRVIELTLVMLSSKLKAPYNKYAPMAISLIAWVYNKFMGLPKDPNDPGNGSSLKELAAKILGRYALTATPKIGFVARGKAQTQLMTEYTQELTHEGSLEDAYRKVMDDGTSAGETSVREQMFVELADRHQTFTRNRKIVSITSRITSIAQYASSIDPTNITRIVAIAAGAASTGLLAHSAYRTGSMFVRMQKDYAVPGVRMAFDPGLAGTSSEEDALIPARADATFAEAAMNRAETAYAGFEEALRVARHAAGYRGDAVTAGHGGDEVDAKFLAAAEALDAADQELEDAMGSVMALGFVAEGTAEAQEGGLVAAASTEVLTRADAVSGVLHRGLGFGSTKLDPAKEAARKAAISGLVSSLRNHFAQLASSKSEMGARVVVTESKIKELSGGKLRIDAVVRNVSDVNLKDITVQLQSGLHFEVEGDTKVVIESLRKGRKARVRWTITPSEDFGLFPLVAIMPEGDGIQGVSKLQSLRAE